MAKITVKDTEINITKINDADYIQGVQYDKRGISEACISII